KSADKTGGPRQQNILCGVVTLPGERDDIRIQCSFLHKVDELVLSHAAADANGKLLDRGIHVSIGHCQFAPELTIDLPKHVQHACRVASQLEEILGSVDLLEVQQLFPDSGDSALNTISGLIAGVFRKSPSVHRRVHTLTLPFHAERFWLVVDPTPWRR